ncbi:hypothetical protein DICPUDRAFT_160372 [Dictyostelium purpureum]|uniref:Uncharacterized protein n=1 Tax=Dictyostelium purpureum TaxID=5786 RepID=F1A681_DICPU|nr:uncharacterized protein DICPUDRAFT_160372 [Dictyostelium purpureum]EGC28300.1 hypothetical protein DICPUDRAFT_160372 [Dictyostelium purpureum]|eukprot:XP_003295175.1 hypothetical protein DICPUDRAFT_160372 [Dictyostelium purpureum]
MNKFYKKEYISNQIQLSSFSLPPSCIGNTNKQSVRSEIKDHIIYQYSYYFYKKTLCINKMII